MTEEEKQDCERFFTKWLRGKNLNLDPNCNKVEVIDEVKFEDKLFAIIKFKLENNEKTLWGFCEVLKENVRYDNIIFSYLEELNENTKESAVFSIKKFKDTNIFLRIQTMKQEGKWNEIIALVDENVEKYASPREIDGIKCYQFLYYEDFIYCCFNCEEGTFKNVQYTELRLLLDKLYALVELKDERGYALAEELKKISPFNISIMFEEVELAKNRKEYDKLQNFLDEMYPYLWRAVDFSRYLRVLAWLRIEQDRYKDAIYYLSWAINYDNSDRVCDYVYNELNYIQQKYHLEKIDRPTDVEVFEYFTEKGEKFEPCTKSFSNAMNIYDFYLDKNNNIDQKQIDYIRNNLIDLGRGWLLDAKMVEVSRLTPNKLIVSFKNNFNFQIPKEYNKKTKDEDFNEFEGAKGTIIIEKDREFISDEDYEKKVKEIIEEYKQNYNITFNGNFICLNKMPVTKIIVQNENEKLLVYIIKMNPNSIGRIYSKIGDDSEEIEKDFRTIVNTWDNISKNKR